VISYRKTGRVPLQENAIDSSRKAGRGNKNLLTKANFHGLTYSAWISVRIIEIDVPDLSGTFSRHAPPMAAPLLSTSTWGALSSTGQHSSGEAAA